MKKNQYLAKVAVMLNKQKFHTCFRDENLLELSFDKAESPFAFLVVEEDQFPGIVISFSVDFFDVYQTADLMLSLLHIVPVALGETFYRSKSGELHWDSDATYQWEFENNPKFLTDIEPVSNNLH